MKPLTLTLLSMFFASLAVVSSTYVSQQYLGFTPCMSLRLDVVSSRVVCSLAACNRYSELLLSSQQNLRWVDETASTPLYIVNRKRDSQVDAWFMPTVDEDGYLLVDGVHRKEEMSLVGEIFLPDLMAHAFLGQGYLCPQGEWATTKAQQHHLFLIPFHDY